MITFNNERLNRLRSSIIKNAGDRLHFFVGRYCRRCLLSGPWNVEFFYYLRNRNIRKSPLFVLLRRYAFGHFVRHANFISMKHLFATAAFLLFALSASAQRLRLDISLSGDTSEIVKVLVQPLNTGAENRNIVLRRKNGIYTASVKFSDVGLYNLIVVKGISQLSVPFSLSPAENAPIAANLSRFFNPTIKQP